MSRPSCTDERGQALTELVLAACLLLPVFMLFYQVTRLVYARLELISLTRETALFLIHENRHDLPGTLVKDLAKKTRLDPEQVSAKVTAVGMSGQFADMPVIGVLGKLASRFLLGSNLKIQYRTPREAPHRQPTQIFFATLAEKLKGENSIKNTKGSLLAREEPEKTKSKKVFPRGLGHVFDK